MRRLHFTVGALGVVAFLLTGDIGAEVAASLRSLGLDVAKFEKDMASPEVQAQIDKEMQEARAAVDRDRLEGRNPSPDARVAKAAVGRRRAL